MHLLLRDCDSLVNNIETEAHEIFRLRLSREVQTSADDNARPAFFVLFVDKGLAALVLVHDVLERDVVNLELDLPVHPFPPHHYRLLRVVLSASKKRITKSISRNRSLNAASIGSISFSAVP